jgi:hypothetical protein
LRCRSNRSSWGSHDVGFLGIFGFFRPKASRSVAEDDDKEAIDATEPEEPVEAVRLDTRKSSEEHFVCHASPALQVQSKGRNTHVLVGRLFDVEEVPLALDVTELVEDATLNGRTESAEDTVDEAGEVETDNPDTTEFDRPW